MSYLRISVIMLVYNAEATIRRCVDSVLYQTYNDFECLLINDCSKDRSGEICDEYAAKDSRVRVFHKENGGVSSARNVGLDNASGEWIAFVDSDDWVDLDFLQSAQNDIVKGYQFIAYSCHPCDLWGQELLPDCDCSDVTKTSGILSSMISSILFMTPWAKLFKESILRNRNLRFDVNLPRCEDTLFNFEFFQSVDKLCLRSNCIYHYSRGDTNSLSMRVLSWEQIE